MNKQAKATFMHTKWDEKTWDGKPSSEVEGEKHTQARVEYIYKGDLEGESTLEYVMVYCTADTGSFVGLEKIVGSLDGKSGSFTLQHIGTFNGPAVDFTVTVVPGSGRDALKGLRGEGTIHVEGHQEEGYAFAMAYDFEG